MILNSGLPYILSVPEEHRRYKDNFLNLLHQMAVTGELDKAKFVRVVDRIMQKSYEEVKGCITPQFAKELYDRYQMITTATMGIYDARGIILDGELPGATSNHANFIRVLVDTIKIFKHPKEKGNVIQIKKVLKDVQICKELAAGNNGKPIEGLVNYDEFCIITASNEKIPGSLSNLYAMTVADLHRPVNAVTLSKIIGYVKSALERVHSLQYVMVDLKPNNLFMTDKMIVHIGDFGGCVRHGQSLDEYTMEFIPSEFITENKASYAIDKYCLVTSVLFMMQKQVMEPTLQKVRDAVETIETGCALKPLLTALLN